MQPVAFFGLLIDDVLQLRQVAGTGANKFFLERDLQDHIEPVLAGGGGKRPALFKLLISPIGLFLLFQFDGLRHAHGRDLVA